MRSLREFKEFTVSNKTENVTGLSFYAFQNFDPKQENKIKWNKVEMNKTPIKSVNGIRK